MLDKFAIARALRELGQLLGLRGDDHYKARAYENGAHAVEAASEELGALVGQGRLTSLRGIGGALAAQIEELWRTGRSGQLERLRAEVPPGFIELSQVPRLGAKKIRALAEALGIDSVPALKEACETGRVRSVRGFGAKTEQRILDGIGVYESAERSILLLDAVAIADDLLRYLRDSPLVARAEVAGSVRRRQETVAEVDLVVEPSAPDVSDAIVDHFARYPLVARLESSARGAATARLASGVKVDLRVAELRHFAATLHAATGSHAHLDKLLEVARRRKVTLDDAASEEELYQRMELPYIPPELREDAGEIEGALAGERFDDLVTLDDVRGLVHCHTSFSDGKDTVEAMARAADALGMRYLTITDHSPSAHYAGGVSVDRLRAQWDEIARVQELVEVRILRGTESDILDSGALDYPDAILERLDVVIASIHSRMKMDEEQMTRRLVAAMRQPIFKIWGHALGRLLLRRPPFACRVEEVLDAVAESRAAIEVNGDPHRLDLEPRWIRAARARGIPFVISTDAHSTRGFGSLRWGVDLARRGGLRRREVLNTLDATAFAEAVRPAAH